MKFQPVLHVGSQTWMVGVIQNHQARPLTRQEVEEVCAQLNRPAPEKQPMSSAWRPYDER